MTDPTTPPSTPDPEPTAASTIDELRAKRVIKGRPGPSGNRYDLRPVDLVRMTLTGGMPSHLRAVAKKGKAGVDEQLLASGSDTATDDERHAAEWLDRLVAAVIVSPSLVKEDGTPDPELMELIPPVDYHWACLIATGDCDTDGEGRLLWGRAPLGRWESFRLRHLCDADCEGCRQLVDDFSAAVG